MTSLGIPAFTWAAIHLSHHSSASLKSPDDILVKCLLNEMEATLPVETDAFPYYRWSDVREYYMTKCSNVK